MHCRGDVLHIGIQLSDERIRLAKLFFGVSIIGVEFIAAGLLNIEPFDRCAVRLKSQQDELLGVAVKG